MTGQVSTKAHSAAQDRASMHAELPRQPPLDRCYREPQRAEILDFLLHLGPYTSDVLFVLGAKGSGKTTLIRQFLSRVADSWRVAYVSADKHSLPDDVAHAASEAWGAQHDMALASGVLTDVGKSAGDAHGRGHRPILVIDEAQFLPDATLSWLAQGCETAQRDKNALGLVICGESELLLSPATARLRKLPHHTFELTPLDQRQTTALVAQQCEVLGFPENTLSAAEAAAIFHKAKGNLGRSVELIAEKLQPRVADAVAAVQGMAPPQEDMTEPAETTAAEKPPRRAATPMRTPWAVAGALGVVLAAALWFQQDINNLVAPSAPQAVMAPVIVPEQPAVSAPSVAPRDDAAASSVPSETVLPQEATNASAITTEAREPSLSAPEVLSLGSPAQVASATEVAPSATTPVTAPVVEPEPVAPKQAANDSPPKDAPKTAAEPANQKPAKVAAASSSLAATDGKAGNKAAPASVPSGPRDEAWLAAQSSTAFTIQLMAVNQEQVLHKVLKRLSDPSPMAIYHFRRGEGVMYGLVYGLYPTYEAAVAARSRVPKAVGPVQPWVRKLSVVQEEIRRANEPVAATADPASNAAETAGTAGADNVNVTTAPETLDESAIPSPATAPQ